MSITTLPRKLLFAATMIINLIIAAGTVFSAYGGMIDPHTSGLPAVASLTFPIFLVATVLLLILNVFISRRIALINLATLVACVSPALRFCPMHLSDMTRGNVPASEREKAFSLVTYNVLGFTDMRGTGAENNTTLQYLIDADADIVAMQEAVPIDRNTPGITTPQLDTLLARYPYRTFGAEGQGLLSKHPFEEISLNPKPEATYQVRCYRITIDSRTIHLVNVHLKSIGLTPSDKQLYRQVTDGVTTKEEIREVRKDVISKLTAAFRVRADQAGMIRSALEELQGDVILCGDFNDIPGSYAQREIMSAGFDDAYAQAGFGPAITYHADRFYFRIDHILYRGAIKPWKVKCERIPSSDHYPLQAVFLFE